MADLRKMASPDVTGIERSFRASAGSMGSSDVTGRSGKISDPLPSDRVMYQTRVAPYMANTLDITAQAVLSSDRRQVRLSLTPVFSNASTSTDPVVNNPLIPGK